MATDHKFTPDELIGEYMVKYPALISCRDDILKAADTLTACYKAGGKVLLCGNGGSSADSAHIVGELLKGFLQARSLPEDRRKALRAYGELGELMADKLQGALAAVDLTTQQAILSAVANDTDPRLAYAQQVWGLGRPGDVLIGISTSGNAANVCCAGIAAKELGMTTIAMTGSKGGKMAGLFDHSIKVPSDWTPGVQEYHLPVYHLICALVECAMFPQ